MKAPHVVACVVLLLAAPGGAYAQRIKAVTVPPHVGETITIELDRSLSANESASWSIASGQGEIVPDRSGARIAFRATAEGRVVVLCVVRSPDGERRPAEEFFVRPGATATPQPLPAPAPLPARPPSPPSTATAMRRPTPADGLALKDVDLIQASGWMGDSMTENGETARIDPNETANCRSGPTCYRVEYDKGGKLRWAAFGLQYVPEGAPMNWGEFKGMNLSDRAFRSVRAWAKAATAAKVQFKSGGNVAPNFTNTNAATYSIAGPTVTLSNTYREYCLDLTEKSLRNVVSPLTIVLTKAANPQAVVAFVDDISFSTAACPKQ